MVRRGLLAVSAAAIVLISLGAVFSGQGASSRKAEQALRITPLVRGLSSPVLVTAPASEPGRLYVVEQGGTIRIVERGRVRRQPFLDISSRVRSGGERGLLGLAFHPDYPQDPRLYVNYTDLRGDTRVVEYRAFGGRAVPLSARVVLTVRQPYVNHNGGMVAFGPDGFLYVGMGDGGSGGDPENRAQNMGSLLGKLLRLDVDRRGAKPQIAALGLRNPWRFSFDRANGDLYIGDVGQGAIEEIDYVQAGTRGLLNFGWDVKEGRAPFEDKPLGAGRLVDPIAQYTHSVGCTVVGGHVYRGKAVPRAVGRYFYGDYCAGTVWSLKVSGERAVRLRREPFRVGNLVSFGEDAAGELYVVSHDGTIYRLR